MRHDFKEVTLRSGDRIMRGRLFGTIATSTKQPAVVFIHGLKSSQAGYESRAEAVSQALKALCLTFDLSGHGADAADFAKYSIAEHLEDVMAAYDYLVADSAADLDRVGACGASYGALLAVLLTSRRQVKRLVLRAPAIAGGAPAQSGLQEPELGEGLHGGEEFDSLAVLARYSGRVLIVESEKDEVIPHAQIAAYLRASPNSELEVIKGATHTLTNPMWDRSFVEAIIHWFRDL